jgi:hypothetical protein
VAVVLIKSAIAVRVDHHAYGWRDFLTVIGAVVVPVFPAAGIIWVGVPGVRPSIDVKV